VDILWRCHWRQLRGKVATGGTSALCNPKVLGDTNSDEARLPTLRAVSRAQRRAYFGSPGSYREAQRSPSTLLGVAGPCPYESRLIGPHAAELSRYAAGCDPAVQSRAGGGHAEWRANPDGMP
jgi:hypothetical protein